MAGTGRMFPASMRGREYLYLSGKLLGPQPSASCETTSSQLALTPLRASTRKKRTPMRSATVAGYESAVTWLNNVIGDKPLADVKNEVARELVTAMKAAKHPLADKTIVTYFQVVKAVVASAVNKEGEQLHSRNWNLHHIGLPIVNERKQSKPAFTAREVEQIVSRAAGRYRILFALLAGSGLRIGEAL